ncbi:MAG: response regulator [Candidatus Omnitrophota bacterium]
MWFRKNQPVSGIRLKVVVADDDPVVRTILEKGLTAEGHTVFLAGDGEEAFKKISDEKPDLAILDIMMPKRDGILVLQSIKATPQTRNLPVIILTSKSEDKDLLNGYEFGANYYITKPFKISSVLFAIQTLFGPSKNQPEKYTI